MNGSGPWLSRLKGQENAEEFWLLRSWGSSEESWEVMEVVSLLLLVVDEEKEVRSVRE